MISFSKSTDEKLSNFICAYLMFNAVNATLQDVFGMSGSKLAIVKIGIKLVLAIMLLACIHKMDIKTVRMFFWAYILCGLALLYSVLIGTSFKSLSSWAVTLTTVCLPLGVSAFAIREKNVLYKTMVKYSYYILIINIVDMFFTTDDFYNMHFSYSVLFVLMIHLNEFLNQKKKLFLILSIFEVSMIVLYGSRGALVCVVVFLVINVIRKNLEFRSKLLYLVSIFIASIGAYFAFNELSPSIFQLLISKGVSSRTINLLFSGNFLKHDSNRSIIWERAMELISQRPVFGWGIGGFTDALGAPYPHNLFLDLLLAFGYLIGGILIVTLIIIIIKAVYTAEQEERYLTFIFVSIALVCLMFSGTVFTNYYFFIMLGLVLSVNKYTDFE